jgi:glycosyltransferase involved in cell wall biosynthesis
MLKVGIFMVMTGRQAGGPETYERSLVQALSRVDARMHLQTYCLAAGAPALLPAEGELLHHHVLQPSWRVFSTSVSLPWRMHRDGIDLLHAPFTPPPFSNKPYVFTHHCFSTFNHPEFYDPRILVRLNALIKRGLQAARHIICVSQCTLDYTAELFKLDRSRMSVVHNGVGPEFQPSDHEAAQAAMAQRHGLKQPYFLFVGKLEARKNIVRILEAFDAFRHECRDPVQLVLAGRRTPLTEGLDEIIRQRGLASQVVEIGYVPDADLPLLYRAAHAFVFPTLWEGFGIPVLEAMACGTPVITSNLSSLPEVAADAALLVDPRRSDDIAQAMLRLWREPALHRELTTRGLANASRFSWERTARETSAVYRAACSV